MKNRRSILSIAFLSLFLFVAWSGWQWDQAEAEFQFACDQLVECRRLASRIHALRLAPTRYDESQRSNEALSQLVETAAESSGISRERIRSIDPGEPRRVGDTPYKEQETRVELSELTVQQLVKLMLAVPAADSAIQVTTLFMRTPAQFRNDSDHQQHEFWNADLILTSQFYAPIVAPSR